MLLAACAPRGDIVIDPRAADVGTIQPIHVASMRTAGGQRLQSSQFFGLDISVPPDRAAGTLAYPKGERKSDPQTQFMVVEGGRLADEASFRHAIERDLARRKADDRDLVLFVHGYNTSFAEGVYRHAQIVTDLDLPGAQAQFSWPSLADPLRYTGDRDAVLYSRDGLAETIRSLSAVRGRSRLILVGHSMGSALLMESLRQLALSGQREVLDQIGGVILISPDLDVGVFQMQARAIGRLPHPFVIFSSKRDKALRLSALISDEPVRLGNLADAQPLADLEVLLVDIGAFSTGIGHFNVAESPALMSILTKARQLDQAFPDSRQSPGGIFADAAIRVERAAQVVLLPGY